MENAIYLTKKQAALCLAVDVKTIDELLKLEVLQSLKIGEHRVFKEEFIQEFMNYMDDLAEDTHVFKRDGYLG